jgi:endonuclease YncB( thermonuclease family)
MKLIQSIAKSTLIALLGLSISAIAFEGKVVGVSDGDTIVVLDSKKEQHKIRVAGIDAPEKSQDFGSKAKEHMSDLVFGKTVSLPDAKTDKYGRTVSRVLVGNKDAGLEMIKAGMAWHYKKYEIEQSPADRASYGAAEINARNARVGLWSQVTPTRPEDFRYESKAPKAAGSGTECPCGTNNFCTGSRGGSYCVNGSGKKKYASQ